MRFVAFSPLLSIALLLGVLGLIIVAYSLKPKRRQVAISSLAIWGKVLRQHKALVSRWRWLLSLLLACAIGGVMALALSRPEVPAIGAISKRVVLILDNSPSMAARTRDGNSRWLHALFDARRLIAQLGSASEVMVLDTMGRAPLAGFVTPQNAWRQLEKLSVATAGTARLPEVPRGGGNLQVHVFSDGVGVPEAPVGARVHSAFETAFNLSLSAFETRSHASDATKIEGLLQVFNPTQMTAKAVVTITGPQHATSRTLEIAPGESATQSIDLSHAQAGIYRAELKADGDALVTDNVAYSVVAPHRTQALLLVTQGNAFLEDSLRSLPGVQLTTVKPIGYRQEARFDAYVFDRFSPDALPAAGTLLLGADARMGRAGGEATVTRWDSAHPVASGVSWHDLRIHNAVLSNATNEHAIVRAALDGKIGNDAALIAIGEDATGKAGARWIRVGFALHQTNFHLQPGFPVFLGQAVHWLTRGSEAMVRHIGGITIPLQDVALVDTEGESLTSVATADGTLFQAMRPGVYTATAAGREWQIVANVLDPAYGQINRSQWRARSENRATQLGGLYLARSELWTLLLCVAALLLMLEWFTLTRKLTL